MKKTIFIAAAVCFSSQVLAQDSAKNKQLDEVVVTATKTEVKQSQTGKVVTVIDQATLQRNAGKTVAEILNYQAGIFINGANNNLGTNQDLYFRGASTGNVLVLLDGTPVNDASQINNSFDINNININQVERIEILKGAQSTLWGSDAVAGVINIITKKSIDKKGSPNASIAFGSFGTLRLNAGVSGKANKLSYNLNYGHLNSKGFSNAHDSAGNKNFDKDGFKQNSLLAGIGYQFTKQFSAHYTGNYSKYKADIDEGAFRDDVNYTSESENFTNNVRLHYKTEKASLQLIQTLTNAKRLLANDSTPGVSRNWSRGIYNGNTNATELFGNFKLAKHFSLVGGLQYLAQNTSQSYKSISSFGPFDAQPVSKDIAKANNLSAYASLSAIDLKGFNAELGFRFNKHSIYGNNTTFSFNPSYRIDENTRVFVNISSAYKIPSLYQLHSEYGNKNLKPENSNNYEIGVQSLTNNKRNSIRMVAFKRDIKDLIVFYTDASWNSYYINRDEQNDYGFELESNIAIGKAGSWATNFTYLDGEGKVENIKTRNLYRRPNFTLNSTLTVEALKGLTIAPSFRFVGTRAAGQYDPGPSTQPSYYTIDLNVNYAFAKQFKAFVDLRNITNQKYFDIVGYNSRQFNAMAGIAFNF